jgi:hypothetical protein
MRDPEVRGAERISGHGTRGVSGSEYPIPDRGNQPSPAARIGAGEKQEEKLIGRGRKFKFIRR